MPSRARRALALVLPLCSALAALACTPTSTPTATPVSWTPRPSPTPAAGIVHGVGISPRGFPTDYGEIEDFYTEVATFPDGGVLWNGAWREDVVGGTDAGQVPKAPATIARAADGLGIRAAFVFGWRSGTTLFVNVPTDPTNDWSNAEARRSYARMVADFGATYRPPFLFLGNESDIYHGQDAADYANWIDAYEQAYDAVKSASPGTLVGPVFSFEHLSGQGVLTGWSTPHWPALEMHDVSKMDIVGLTVYPFFDFARPEDIPDDYLSPLFERIGSKPIGITETGWPAEDTGGLDPPWETSEDAQTGYLARLATLLAGREVKMIDWLFLYPMADPGGSPTAWKLFSSVSLRGRDGEKRPVYDAWVAFSP